MSVAYCTHYRATASDVSDIQNGPIAASMPLFIELSHGLFGFDLTILVEGNVSDRFAEDP